MEEEFSFQKTAENLKIVAEAFAKTAKEQYESVEYKIEEDYVPNDEPLLIPNKEGS